MAHNFQKRLKHYHSRAKNSKLENVLPVVIVVLIFAVIGVRLLYLGHAATFATSKEAENGTISGNATIKNGTNASNGQFVKFGGSATDCTPTAAMPAAGCRPLIGATALGNPGTPTEIANGTAPAADNVSQFDYFEKLTNQSLDIYRGYDSPPSSDTCPGGGCGVIPLAPDEKHYGMAGKVLHINWNPAQKFADAESVADGGTQYINNNIVQAAKNIKAIAPTPVFLSPWHEINENISALDPEDPSTCKPGAAKTAGTPDEFKAAWINMHNIFKAQGVTNVIWGLGYGSYQPRDCFVPLAYPGNQYVDWVFFDSYDHNSGDTFANTIGRFYNLLKSSSTTAMNFNSKPWGVGEFGTCGNTDVANAAQYYRDAKSAFDAGTYPNLKSFEVYANDNGPDAGAGCFTDYDSDASDPTANTGTYDAQKQTIFNAFWADLAGN